MKTFPSLAEMAGYPEVESVPTAEDEAFYVHVFLQGPESCEPIEVQEGPWRDGTIRVDTICGICGRVMGSQWDSVW